MTKAFQTKHRSAVGLSYDSGSGHAPSVSVKGENLYAEEIVKLARRFGIPVLRRAELSNALQNLQVDQEVPKELFEAIAQVLLQIEKRLK